MRTLPPSFEQATDRLEKHRFQQVARKGNVAVYSRTKMDGTLFGFEVFRLDVRRFPAKHGYTEPREVYPRASRFGKTAWFCTTFDRAMSRFDTLVEKEQKR